MKDILLKEMPKEWGEWPIDIEVAFAMNQVSGVSGGLYEEYAVRTCRQAARSVFTPDNYFLFLSYRLHTVDVVPLFQWNVTWPVLRKGGNDQFEERYHIQGAAPWDFEADNTLCRLYKEPLSDYGYSTRYMLTAGGRSKEDAERNWHACARAFRKIYRQVAGKKRGK